MCTNCTKVFKKGLCDVHRIVHNDIAERDVYFCKTCGAWLCKECSNRFDLRAFAAAKQLYLKLKSKL